MNNENNILSILLFIYLIISQIATVYFLFLYIKSHSFFESLLFGPFVAEFKGLLWPFFI